MAGQQQGDGVLARTQDHGPGQGQGVLEVHLAGHGREGPARNHKLHVGPHHLPAGPLHRPLARFTNIL